MKDSLTDRGDELLNPSTLEIRFSRNGAPWVFALDGKRLQNHCEAVLILVNGWPNWSVLLMFSSRWLKVAGSMLIIVRRLVCGLSLV